MHPVRQNIGSHEQPPLSCLQHLFKPLAAFCIRRGIKIQAVIGAVKAAFVEAAGEELERQGSAVSVSRLGVMTGLQRKDISQITCQAGKPEEHFTLLTKVLGTWGQHPEFTDQDGTPRPLTCEGNNSEFAALARSVSKDLNHYPLLFELERIAAVRKEDGRVCLAKPSYEPSGDIQEGLTLLAADTNDFVFGVEQNLFGKPKIPNLHIKTHYDNIIQEALPEIRKWFLGQGARFHAEARAYLSRFDKDLNPELYDKKGGARAVIGSFSRVESPYSPNAHQKQEDYEG